MGWLSFTSLPFFLAGAACAAGPIIIHLLNRRRYRVVHWAAMDFLRQALTRNRKILQIRDLVLLVIRTAAVLLFGAALARPYFAKSQQQFDERQPLHAVIVIDNSLSMAYRTLDGSLLDKAKDRARQLIDRLPAGSRTSIIPACGSRELLSFDPYETKESAVEAVARLQVVDRSLSLTKVAGEVRRASEAAPELAKRVVLITDQQRLNWQGAQPASALKGLPALQIVSIAPPDAENTWIADLRLQDGLADVETPATVIVEVAHRGTAPRRDLEVTLSVGDTVMGQQTISIESGQGTREVSFQCVFSTLSELPEPDKPVFVPLCASITSDRLPVDDKRWLAAPVVAALPVVFVDQFSPDQEDVLHGRLGETRHLRTLLAPRTTRADARRQLIHVRHVNSSGLSRELLSDARLVVVAGVREPGEMTPLLREYVEQGGQLLIAAGAEFDPAAWNGAWDEGRGILPLPLAADPIGQTPEEAGDQLKPFFLSFESLASEGYFHLAGVGESELKDLYAEPFFFKAARVESSPQVLEALVRVEKERDSRPATESPATWLLWADHEDIESADDAADAVSGDADQAQPDAQATAPRILARYELPGQPAFLVSRRIGRGEVLFCSTGLLSSWNTLPKTNAVLMFDRILRGMIQSTLPDRNLAAMERFTLPLPEGFQNQRVTLTRPGADRVTEPLDITYIGSSRRGVVITGLLERGVYRVSGFAASRSLTESVANEKPAWEVPLVIGGNSEESDLTPLDRKQLDVLRETDNLSFIAPGEEISLAGEAIRGQNSWWWLALLVLVLLLVELSVLAFPSFALSRDLAGPGPGAVSSRLV